MTKPINQRYWPSEWFLRKAKSYIDNFGVVVDLYRPRNNVTASGAYDPRFNKRSNSDINNWILVEQVKLALAPIGAASIHKSDKPVMTDSIRKDWRAYTLNRAVNHGMQFILDDNLDDDPNDTVNNPYIKKFNVVEARNTFGLIVLDCVMED